MDRELIIRLAREAGYIGMQFTSISTLERFAALIEEHLKSQGYRQCAKGQRTTQFCGMLQEAVKAEREACAKVCDKMWHEWLNSPIENEPNKPDAEDCAEAIRARAIRG